MKEFLKDLFRIRFLFILMILFSGCTSQVSTSASDSLSESLMNEIALAAGVDVKILRQEVGLLMGRGGLFSLSQIDSEEDFSILACVADNLHDGTLNLSDVVLMASQLEKTCAQIAQESQANPDLDNDIPCMNLDRNSEEVNIEDVAVFTLLLNEHPNFSTDLCHNPEAGDADQLSPYTEAIAWVNSNPLNPQTFGLPDYEYYLNLLGSDTSSCGNGVLDDGEVCDGADLNGATCSSLGYESGSLSCTEDCQLDVWECTNPLSDVEITSVNGTLSDGNSVTLRGSGFGTKATAKPLVFDEVTNIQAYRDYEGANDAFTLQSNAIVPTRGVYSGGEANPFDDCLECPWNNHNYGRTPRFYQGAHSRYPGHISYRAANLSNTDGRKGFFARNFAVDEEEGWTYLDWWFRSSHNFGGDLNGGVSGKILRLWPHPSIVDQLIIAKHGDAGTETVIGGSACGQTSRDLVYFSAPIEEWVHVAVITHASSSRTTSWTLINGKAVGSVDHPCVGHGVFDYLRVSGYDPSLPENVHPDFEFLWGDIYMDSSPARVFVADSPTFEFYGNDSEVHYEMQEVNSWTGSELSITFNKGAFSSGTAYIFVVDGQGSVSNGFPISIP